VDDFKPAGGFVADLCGRFLQILLQQLHMDVERTERIPHLMREARQQPREQPPLLLRGKLAHILPEGIGENLFHSPPQDAKSPKPKPDLSRNATSNQFRNGGVARETQFVV
jgi:hypothetical protein